MSHRFVAALAWAALALTPLAAAGQNGKTASSPSACWDALAQKEKDYEAIKHKPLPDGATPGLRRVMWMTADSIKLIDAHCVGDAMAAEYRSQLQASFNQAKTACEQLTAGGACSAHPFDGSPVQDPQDAARQAAQRQAAEQQAAQGRAAAQAQKERQAELKRQQELQELNNALGNLMQTLQSGKSGGGDQCPRGHGMVNGRCRAGVAQ
jgi:hypothetical protein